MLGAFGITTNASSYAILGKIGQGAFASVLNAQTTVSPSSSLSSSMSSNAAGPLQEQQQLDNKQQQSLPPETKSVTVQLSWLHINVLNLDHLDS